MAPDGLQRPLPVLQTSALQSTQPDLWRKGVLTRQLAPAIGVYFVVLDQLRYRTESMWASKISEEQNPCERYMEVS